MKHSIDQVPKISKPTYGELIDLFETTPNKDLLFSEFKRLYPNVSVGRSERFYDTVLRTRAPTQPSVLGAAKLSGSHLATYRKKIWKPRVRNCMYSGDELTFPEILTNYGLNEEILEFVLLQTTKNDKPFKWCLKSTPKVGFYQELHLFLKKWPVSTRLTKIAIGRFYIAIDPNMEQKGIQADNVYRLVDKLSKSDQSSDRLMSYGSSKSVSDIRAETQPCISSISSISSDYNDLKSKLEQSKKQLSTARKALQDITNEKLKLKKKCTAAENKAAKVSRLKLDYALLEDGYAQLEEDNVELLDMVAALRNELATNAEESACLSADCKDFTLQTKTKNGTRYSPVIRKLYYSLLSDGVASNKIAGIIKIVWRCFFPSVNIEHLKLPHRGTADYMRRDELQTISNAHKATVLSNHASENRGFMMNTDGTTKCQKKLGGVAINGMTISVNELPDGTAESTIDDVSRELEKLRQTAHSLGLPNPDGINWTLVTASSSDSAVSQKKVNKLIEKHRERDEEMFGPATGETIDLIVSFCSMHLGINLRKAFLSGIIKDNDTSQRHHPVDTFVHEFCKVFGKHGTPEYGCGVNDFPDFLARMIEDNSLSEDVREYYRYCASTTLHRQVGSRYFISACNATKILFLREAAVKFLQYTGKDQGNQLERDLAIQKVNRHR